MAQTTILPLITAESGLIRYLEKVRRFPMLQQQEEYMLAKRWRERDDRNAAHKLVTSHLRLVAKIAMGYRGYGLPISEVISEGNVAVLVSERQEGGAECVDAMRPFTSSLFPDDAIAVIYKPARSATTSGTARTRDWNFALSLALLPSSSL